MRCDGCCKDDEAESAFNTCVVCSEMHCNSCVNSDGAGTYVDDYNFKAPHAAQGIEA